MFPLLFRSPAMKWSNIASRGLTIFAPLGAELPDPQPIYVVLFVIIVTLISVLNLDKPKDDENKEGDDK
jgi:hypothetical protein